MRITLFRLLTVLLAPALLAGIDGCTIVIGVRPAPPAGPQAPGPDAANPSGTNPGGGAPPPAPPAPPSPEPSASLPPPSAPNPSPSAPPPSPSGTAVIPPVGGSSGGKGGAAPLAGTTQNAGGVQYNLIVPASYNGAPTPLLLVYSGTEGAGQMTTNMRNLAPGTGLGAFLIAVLDGKQYYGNGQAGAAALDDVRARYNVDNDRTCLLGESAGTSAALQLGFHLRQSFFAAYWANDINAVDAPERTAAQLGFAPFGQVGPGGQLQRAQQIVEGMRRAAYQLPATAPYAGPGAGQHGNPQQLIEALRFFPGKTRR